MTGRFVVNPISFKNKTGAPYSIKIVYNTPTDCDDAIKSNSQKGLERIDARTVEKRLDTIIDFNDLRL